MTAVDQRMVTLEVELRVRLLEAVGHEYQGLSIVPVALLLFIPVDREGEYQRSKGRVTYMPRIHVETKEQAIFLTPGQATK